MTNEKNLKGKISVVVGSTGGIGLAVAKELYADGASVVIIGRTKERAVKAAAEIAKINDNIFPLAMDITNDKQTKQAITKVIKKFGKIDFLIVCSGIFKPFGTFESIPFKDNLEPMEVNLIGTMRCVYHTIKYMKKQRFGRILVFSGGGIGGDLPITNAVSYFTSKGAIAIFAEVLAQELLQFNITINAILPGQILTDSTKATFKISKKKLGPVLSKATEELKKTGGNSKEPVINLIKFIISEKGTKITGRLLSAKWDKLDDHKNKISDEKYKLRRIEGNLYRRNDS